MPRSRAPGSRLTKSVLASLYDCYTIMVLLTLEEAGFCKAGEAGGGRHEPRHRGGSPDPGARLELAYAHGNGGIIAEQVGLVFGAER